MMEKTFDPAAVEARIAAAWEQSEAFKAGRPERAGAEPFTIVIPPPNVTGNLHMGHALNNTLQDILCRFERMRGKDVLWQPGTDHAGIATQMVVERQLAERGEKDRRTLGREAFLEKIWAWKEESGGAIINQLKRLGASCDWSRERFTMGNRADGEKGQMQRAVAKVFVQLHKEGLIYRDKRLVNWDPHFQTAISDLEVVQVECKGSFKWTRGEVDKDGAEVPFNPAALKKVLDKSPNGHLYYFNYPLEGVAYNPDDASTFIQVATTRPETMLGDSGVAVHPENEKLKHLIGRNVVLPLVGRVIPIVGDDYADPEKGTGAVKITPAHDFNDFEVGKRRRLAQINVLDRQARITLNFNEAETGNMHSGGFDSLNEMGRFTARSAIVEMMAAKGFLAKIEPHSHMVPHGDRSNVVIEPYLTDQWYVDAKTMAQPALKAVIDGQTGFIPKNWEKTYFEWLNNIQPWCISRQLWWGHQIPVWYGMAVDEHGNRTAEQMQFVAETEAEAIALAQKYYGKNVKIEHDWMTLRAEEYTDHESIFRDPDVLDTWFSSALWPFSTLGWPDNTPEVARYYPTSTLVTGFDIIFFWVARMMMMGMHFMGEVPFKDIYIHALVRDEKGAKMSKSKGNVIDPLALIDQYGADALRFTLCAMAAQGRDIKLATSRVEGYRNFATKLWNAARFAEMNGALLCPADFDPHQAREILNQWAIAELARTRNEITQAILTYRFNDAASSAYQFVWGVFCDWYVELAKPILQGPESPAKAETRAANAFLLRETLKLLHPFMPFITEELWAAVQAGASNAAPKVLALVEWPDYQGLENRDAEAEVGWLVDMISEIRSVRNEMSVPGALQIPLVLVAVDAATLARAQKWNETLCRLARLSGISFADAAPRSAAQLLVRGTVAALPLEGIIDLGAEAARLNKEIAKLQSDIAKTEAKLANADFIKRAPPEIVEENRERVEEWSASVQKMQTALARLA
ncbi:MAG: valine--tRNA ligase [Hyphomicrobiales bacterium]|nr:valine--tRNA ligase [Hyphomicrobiales bacterium]MDE2115050.1 valine--tRNA ligase [Hyphomicrobiales bacterium]